MIKLDDEFWNNINKIISDNLENSKVEVEEIESPTCVSIRKNSKQSKSTDNSYFIFELNRDKVSYTISAKDKSNLPSDLVIPSTYNNLPVTNIKYNGFQKSTILKSVTIPTSIVSIDDLGYKLGSGAFAGCSNLTAVSFEKDSNIEVIGVSTFAYCTKLEEIYLRTLAIPKLGVYAFCKVSSAFKIYVPETMSEEFKTDPRWKEYKECIFKLQEEDDNQGEGVINYGTIVSIVKVKTTVYSITGDVNITININK